MKNCFLGIFVLTALAGPVAAQIVLKVTRVPAGTPPADTLFVAGSFNGWNPHNTAYALVRNADGSYQITLPGSLSAIEYKRLVAK
jgi:hypothetical protein